MQWLQILGTGFSHLLFPGVCEGCRRPLFAGEDVLCISCETHLPHTRFETQSTNETLQRLSGRFPLQQATSLLFFTEGSLVQHLMHRLKYKDRTQVGLFFGKRLALLLQDWNIDLVVPVPLHPSKEAKRGYNQSAMIARGIADKLDIQHLPNALIRTRHTETQTDKSREERIANVANAFAVKDAKLLAGKHVLLVDDVLTTGATIESCAQALLTVSGLRLSVATAALAAR